MSHYFTDDSPLKQEIKRLSYRFGDTEFIFMTDTGMFSKDRVDPASDVLIRTAPPLKGTLLDMGCGYGCIGIALAKTYSLALTMCDINSRAAQYAETNSKLNGVRATVLVSDCFEGVTGRFDTIAVNPPIHAGKGVTYRMYEDAPAHLNPGGRLYVVTMKQHGAQSTRDKLEAVFGNCEAIYRKKGCYVFESIYEPDDAPDAADESHAL
jgi:16S rRNA (guanine1207-N2)-methyltransferase